MSTITTKDGTQIFYKDWGKGQPIVFSHGWPLSADDWDGQMLYFLHQGYRGFLQELDGPALERVVAYTNTAGLSFENSIQDILLHVALHGQYHRGKVNLILRQAGHSPAPTDYIAYVRGTAAARTEPARPR